MEINTSLDLERAYNEWVPELKYVGDGQEFAE